MATPAPPYSYPHVRNKRFTCRMTLSALGTHCRVMLLRAHAKAFLSSKGVRKIIGTRSIPYGRYSIYGQIKKIVSRKTLSIPTREDVRC